MSPTAAMISSFVRTPSRTISGGSTVVSMIVELVPILAVPPSRYSSTESPSWVAASSTVSAADFPWRFALETASGPVRRSSSRATSSSGMRSATVPRVSPRSQVRDGWARRIRVSGPGQNSSASCST